MSLYPYPSSSKSKAPKPVGITEFEILKASHKFLREEDEKPSNWNEQLAGKYYSNLYREFAVCDLKHYKSGNFALRWRTEEEVLSGAGETTCGNTRCDHHFPSRFEDDGDSSIPLTTLELPFTYLEHEQTKSALVKVVLCGKCFKKLMWKRTHEKAPLDPRVDSQPSASKRDSKMTRESKEDDEQDHRKKKRSREHDHEERRVKSSRRQSKSPQLSTSEHHRSKHQS